MRGCVVIITTCDSSGLLGAKKERSFAEMTGSRSTGGAVEGVAENVMEGLVEGLD